MNLRVVLENKKGFTLVEVLVVLGLLGVVFAFGSLINVNQYTREVAASEVSTLVSVLQKARSKAMNNINGEAHGVVLDDPNEYVIFGVDSGDVSDRIKKNENITLAGVDEIVFEQLSGNADIADEETLTFSNGKIVSINPMGLISW